MKTLKFKQEKKQNFYTATTHNGGEILKSYNTIVGYIAPDGTLYRVRYSTTTGKQITKYYTTTKQHYITAEELHDKIKEFENIDICTEYNRFFD